MAAPPRVPPYLMAVVLGTVAGAALGVMADIAPAVLASVQPPTTVGVSSTPSLSVAVPPAARLPPPLDGSPTFPHGVEYPAPAPHGRPQHPGRTRGPGSLQAGVLAALSGLTAALLSLALPHRKATGGALLRSALPPVAQLPRRLALLSVPAATTLASGPLAWARLSAEVVTESVYDADSIRILEEIRKVLALKANDPTTASAVDALCDQLGEWLAKYRREFEFEGEASYIKVYHAVRIMAGHYAAEGNTVPLDPDRSAKVLVLIDEAELLLKQGK